MGYSLVLNFIFYLNYIGFKKQQLFFFFFFFVDDKNMFKCIWLSKKKKVW